MAAESASGIPLELIALVTPLPADGGPVPGEIIEHQAHAVGHAAVLLADRGVLLAGDMLSDVLIPLLDARRPDQVGAYETALDRLGAAARQVDVLVPGHGAVAEGPEVAARVAADRAYMDALRRGEDPVDARLGPDADAGRASRSPTQRPVIRMTRDGPLMCGPPAPRLRARQDLIVATETVVSRAGQDCWVGGRRAVGRQLGCHCRGHYEPSGLLRRGRRRAVAAAAVGASARGCCRPTVRGYVDEYLADLGQLCSQVRVELVHEAGELVTRLVARPGALRR